MPAHRTPLGSANPEVRRLTEAMTKYYFLFETCSQCVRILPNKSQLYKVAAENWKCRSEFYRPSRGDEQARAKFFSAVDKVCEIEQRTPENCYLIIFACSAAIQVVIDQDLVKLRDSYRRQIMNESRRLSMEQIKANTSTIVVPPPTAQLPAHVVSVFFPATQPKQPFEELIGKQLCYCDPKSGKTKECTVTDHLTSHLRGTYYLVTDNEGRVEEVNEGEMQEILNSLVQ